MSKGDKYKSKLTQQQYDVCWNKGTERAFTGEYWDFFEDGSYLCRCCEKELFDNNDKFDAGCGWPSFDKTKTADTIDEVKDTSLARQRTEVCCKNCGAHLGHVFNDGPTETGLRYCINSASILHKKLHKKTP